MRDKGMNHKEVGVGGGKTFELKNNEDTVAIMKVHISLFNKYIESELVHSVSTMLNFKKIGSDHDLTTEIMCMSTAS